MIEAPGVAVAVAGVVVDNAAAPDHDVVLSEAEEADPMVGSGTLCSVGVGSQTVPCDWVAVDRFVVDDAAAAAVEQAARTRLSRIGPISADEVQAARG